jgi:MFS family permease
MNIKIIFFTIVLYLTGFGILIPILPLISRAFGASPFEVGLVMSLYSLCQFLFAPFWGKLSDLYGRRPILLFCLVGEALSYIIFVFSTELWMLFASRALAGFFGGSISTASAAISDITPPKQRSRGMALIGAAFGLGFLIGPGLGGALAVWGEKLSPGDEIFPLRFAAGFISILCLITFVFAYLKFKETKISERPHGPSANRWVLYQRFLRKPVVSGLIFVFFLNSFCISQVEASLILFAADRFGWTLKEVALGFTVLGLLALFNQGYLVRALLPKLGEVKILFAGVICLALAFGFMGAALTLWPLWVGGVLMSLGMAFVTPSTLGALSLLTSDQEQGEALGTAQGMASLGRILGPASGGFVYGYFGMTTPFLISSLVILSGLIVIWRSRLKIPNSALLNKTST